MSFANYLGGVLGLAAVAIPIGFAAVRLRARLLPGWEGAPARLVEVVLGVSILTVLLQLLGAFGVLDPLALIACSLLIGAGVWRFLPTSREKGATSGQAPPAPTPHRPTRPSPR